MTLTDWHHLEVGTPVDLKVGDAAPVAGNVLSCTRAALVVVDATNTRHHVRWPAADYVTHEDPKRLQWIGPRWRTVTLTIREEPRCAG